MKKFFAVLLVVGSLFFASTADAEIKTYTGVGEYIMGVTETQEQAINRAKNFALRNAQEQVRVVIFSQAKMLNLKLVEDDFVSITGELIKITDTRVEKSLLSSDVLQVRVKVTVQLDTDELQRKLDELAKNRVKPAPIEKPKPVEHTKPKPAPVEKPKPIETPAIKIYAGYGEYVMGEHDTLATAKQGAKDKAIRNALERAGVLIQSRSRTEDSELVEDVITSQTGAVLKVVDVTYERDDLLVKAHVRIEIDAEDLNRRLAEFARQQKH